MTSRELLRKLRRLGATIDPARGKGGHVQVELRGATGLLTPVNVRSYVTRLPQDVDPVAVEPLARAPGAATYTRSA